jgi:hypothetical protein
MLAGEKFPMRAGEKLRKSLLYRVCFNIKDIFEGKVMAKLATCLPADCCYDVQVGRHVYRRTVIMMSKLCDLSTGGLLL